RFNRFRETRVAVLGGDVVARWCALSLIRNGCAQVAVTGDFADVWTEAEALAAASCPVKIERIGDDAGRDVFGAYDIVVVTGTGAAGRVHRLLSHGVPAGRTLIPAWNFGNRSVIGPLSTPGSTGCWSCALLRLGANVDAAAAADLWREIATGAAAQPPVDGPLTGPVAAMSGNLLGYEIFRLVTGALPPETDGQVLVQDLESLDVIAEPVLPHPRCALCTAPSTHAEEAGQVSAAGLSAPWTPTTESAREAEELVEELNRTSSMLVRPYTGVFTRYNDEELTQTPLKVSRVEVALGHGVNRCIAAFDVHHLAAARLRTLYAAAETYVEHVPPTNVVPRPAAGGGGLPVLAPNSLTTGGGAHPNDAEVTGWTTASSLLTKEQVLVPAAAVRTFGPYNRSRLHLATKAGVGAGANAREAAGRGLLSALAHDALLRAVRGATLARPVSTEGFADGPGMASGDPELVFLLKSARNLGLGVELLDLGEGERSSAYVVLARVREKEGGGSWAVSCDLSRFAATNAALRDLLGAVQLRAETGEDVDTGDPLITDLDAGTIAVNGSAVSVSDAATSWDKVLGRLRASGRDALLVPTTPADLPAGGISTARILLTIEAGSDTGGR
ncbi:TOMM precursor leader peptide-binding protein, partial [Streptomyces chartreusis]|uniref:TOMM precursor leader peptide-binding protein n=1 Tax=Streptomyces chartreusis TaxID=1969 RepID=UPI0036B61CCC